MDLQDDHTNPYAGYAPYSSVFGREEVQHLELQLPFLKTKKTKVSHHL